MHFVGKSTEQRSGLLDFMWKCAKKCHVGLQGSPSERGMTFVCCISRITLSWCGYPFITEEIDKKFAENFIIVMKLWFEEKEGPLSFCIVHGGGACFLHFLNVVIILLIHPFHESMSSFIYDLPSVMVYF